MRHNGCPLIWKVPVNVRKRRRSGAAANTHRIFTEAFLAIAAETQMLCSMLTKTATYRQVLSPDRQQNAHA
jgi:hypothetical protein